MKYKKYVLTFSHPDPAVLSFLGERVSREWDSLADARAAGRAARILFGARYKVSSVTVAGPRRAERVKSI